MKRSNLAVSDTSPFSWTLALYGGYQVLIISVLAGYEC